MRQISFEALVSIENCSVQEYFLIRKCMTRKATYSTCKACFFPHIWSEKILHNCYKNYRSHLKAFSFVYVYERRNLLSNFRSKSLVTKVQRDVRKNFIQSGGEKVSWLAVQQYVDNQSYKEHVFAYTDVPTENYYIQGHLTETCAKPTRPFWFFSKNLWK